MVNGFFVLSDEFKPQLYRIFVRLINRFKHFFLTSATCVNFSISLDKRVIADMAI